MGEWNWINAEESLPPKARGRSRSQEVIVWTGYSVEMGEYDHLYGHWLDHGGDEPIQVFDWMPKPKRPSRNHRKEPPGK